MLSLRIAGHHFYSLMTSALSSYLPGQLSQWQRSVMCWGKAVIGSLTATHPRLSPMGLGNPTWGKEACLWRHEARIWRDTRLNEHLSDSRPNRLQVDQRMGNIKAVSMTKLCNDSVILGLLPPLIASNVTRGGHMSHLQIVAHHMVHICVFVLCRTHTDAAARTFKKE